MMLFSISGVVAADGPTVKWFWGLYNRSKDKYGYVADDTDDCYYVLDGPGYAHHSHLHIEAVWMLMEAQ